MSFDETANLSDEQIEFLNSLFDFARQGMTQALTSVIDQGIPVDLINEKGDTPLILAAYNQHEELVDELIQRQPDLNHANHRGQTALTCAVFTQNNHIVQALMKAGADPDAGEQSASATVEAFDLPAMADLLK